MQLDEVEGQLRDARQVRRVQGGQSCLQQHCRSFLLTRSLEVRKKLERDCCLPAPAAFRLAAPSHCCSSGLCPCLQVRKESDRDRRLNEAIVQLKAQYKDREWGGCIKVFFWKCCASSGAA